MLKIALEGYNKNIGKNKSIELANCDAYVFSFGKIDSDNENININAKHHIKKYGEIGISVDVNIISEYIINNLREIFNDILFEVNDVNYDIDAVIKMIKKDTAYKMITYENNYEKLIEILSAEQEQLFLSLYDSVLFFSKLNEDEEGKKDKEYRLLITRYDNNDLRRDINKYLEENIQMDI